MAWENNPNVFINSVQTLPLLQYSRVSPALIVLYLTCWGIPTHGLQLLKSYWGFPAGLALLVCNSARLNCHLVATWEVAFLSQVKKSLTWSREVVVYVDVPQGINKSTREKLAKIIMIINQGTMTFFFVFNAFLWGINCSPLHYYKLNLVWFWTARLTVTDNYMFFI